MNNKIFLMIGLLCFVVMPVSGIAAGEKCKLPGENHGDNKPSEKKADKLIREGAEICELAKKCDSMEIDVQIKDKKELHQDNFYQNAPADVKKELDESIKDGHGRDGLPCYELEYAVK